jgi:sugar lactone lactonase YvrE
MKKLFFLLCTTGVVVLASCKKSDTVSNKPLIDDSAITVAGGNGQGSAADQFGADGIWSICFDKNMNLYVADGGNNRIQEFPSGSTSATNGIIVAGGNGLGLAANQLDGPADVFVDSSGNIYVADQLNDRIQEFPSGSTSATSGITIAGGNGVGSVANRLYNPNAIFVDNIGNIYVADADNYRVQEFPPGSTSATNGVTIAGGNGEGSAANQLSYIQDIFLDKNGNLYVADGNNNRIQEFPLGSTSATSGITVAGGNGIGSAANQFSTPAGLFVDNVGNIYVADAGNNRVQEFPSGSTSATNGITIAGGNGQGSAVDQLYSPEHVIVDTSGNIYIADLGNYRIQKVVKK